MQLLIVLIRLIIFILLWFIGYDCWLFPNLFNEDAGLIDSFYPFILFNKIDNTPSLILIRVFSALLTGGKLLGFRVYERFLKGFEGLRGFTRV